MAVDPAALAGAWTRSNEEESPGEHVFRPPSFEFPPARGRESFELRPDGTLLDRVPGPADVPAEAEGAWELDRDRLVLRSSAGERAFVVVAIEPDRLVLRAA